MMMMKVRMIIIVRSIIMKMWVMMKAIMMKMWVRMITR